MWTEDSETPTTVPAKRTRAPRARRADASRVHVESPAFAEGERIPAQHARDGANVSPSITWSGLPEASRSLALICEDPDAASEPPFVHWVIYNIPPDVQGTGRLKGIPGGVTRTVHPADVPGAAQGLNSFGHVGYDGPEPPRGSGTHRYHFRIFVLDSLLDVREGMTREALREAMKGHVLGEGETVGTYSR
jgi:Raf kinase inhibitor-like YbhB/YbcL family protein